MTVATIESAPLPDRMKYAETLAAASLIPRAFQHRPADVLVAIEYGNALGIAPIVALSEINVINGTPSLSASMMAALARGAGHKVRVTSDASQARCVIIRADDPDYEHVAIWDEKKARDSNLWGKGHWAKDPGTMLRWRAISECVRMACSEVLGGLKYTPEEVRDFAPAARVDQVKPPTAEQIMAEAETGEVPPPDKITDAQTKKLGALMRELGMTDRADALAFVGEEIGRQVASRSDLTKSEAHKVIDRLEELKAAQSEPETVEAEVVTDSEPAFDDDAWMEQR